MILNWIDVTTDKKRAFYEQNIKFILKGSLPHTQKYRFFLIISDI